jgi:hypothetical protein
LFPLADFQDLEQPVTLADLRASEPILRTEIESLQRTHKGPLYLPFALSDKRPVRVAQTYLAKMPRELVLAIRGLQDAISQGASADGAASGRRLPSKPRRPTGSGYLKDVVVRDAIEDHSVAWALSHFEEAGYLVKDVGDSCPYDVLATSDTEELHIEVKGSSGTATTVELTAGEVLDSSFEGEYESVLVVVDQIEWSREPSGTVFAKGGRPRVWRDWIPDSERLDPTRYRYLLPPTD